MISSSSASSSSTSSIEVVNELTNLLQKLALLTAIFFWNLVVAIDSTALSTALPTIAEDLNASSTQAFWCGTSFLLCSAAFQPIFSSCSDALGRKPMIALALLFFTAGNLVCGFSHHISVLMMGRCLQGAGGGGLLTMSYVLMTDEFGLEDRHKAITTISLTWLVGPVVGPILAGGFTEQATWRWIFWFNLPFCAIGFTVLLLMPISYQAPSTGLQRFKHIDYVGAALLVASLTSFLIAVSWGGTMFSWSSAAAVTPLVLGPVGICCWIYYTLYLTQHPLIPIHLIIDNRTALISYFGNLVHGIGFFSGLYYLPLYFQAVKRFTPIMSGVAMLTTCVTAGPAAAITGAIIARTQRIKLIAVIGWVIFLTALSILVLLKESSSTVAWIFLTVPMGLGIGILYPALALATQSAVETSSTKSPEQIARIKGVAAGLNPFFRTIGQTLGVVISQAAFTNEMKKRLGSHAANDAVSLAQVIKMLPAASPERARLISGFTASLHPVWWTIVGVTAPMLVATLFTKDMGLGHSMLQGTDAEKAAAARSVVEETVTEEAGADKKGLSAEVRSIA